MDEIISPKTHPEKAAQQIIVEILRAGKSGGPFTTVTLKENTKTLLTLFDN